MASSYINDIKKLPKPEKLEEQYLYAMLCSLAGVPVSDWENLITDVQPFTRKEQYLKMLYMVIKERGENA